MNKQPQVTERTKAMLCKAFWNLYETRPISRISVREITDGAGYNRGTFYLYYRDVHDMLSQIEDSLLNKFRELVGSMAGDDPHFNVAAGMEDVLAVMRAQAAYMRTLLGDHGDPTFAARLRDVLWPLLDRHLGVDRNPLLDDDERRLMREFYTTGLLAAIVAWLDGDDMPTRRFVEFLVTTLLPDGGIDETRQESDPQ